VNQLSTHTKRNDTLTRPVFEYLEQFRVLLRSNPRSFSRPDSSFECDVGNARNGEYVGRGT
jgi:hypothetical protein